MGAASMFLPESAETYYQPVSEEVVLDPFYQCLKLSRLEDWETLGLGDKHSKCHKHRKQPLCNFFKIFQAFVHHIFQ